MRYAGGVETIAIEPAAEPLCGVVRLPGSKSLTNRALALAALADGVTTLEGALFADDTARMRDCLRALGFSVEADAARESVRVVGEGGRVPARSAQLFVGNSGTTARFITPLVSLGAGTFRLDGVPRMRERPMGDLIRALQQLGVAVESEAGNDCPPLTIRAEGLRGGTCTLRADASSQFLSGLLLAAPVAEAEATHIHLEGPILSAPYIAMTVAMVRDFGARMDISADGRAFVVPGRQRYTAKPTYRVEPDASAASYFWAAAALTGGAVRVEGIGDAPLQGDAAFTDVLGEMGCRVVRAPGWTEVQGGATLQGVRIDMNAISDTVMTLAAIAPFAQSPTVIHNVGHIRHKETDRLAAVATELRRLGVDVDEGRDGLTIYPTPTLRPATIQTYDDHRMAMAFALVGLRTPGIQIADPGCVAKTFPDFFATLAQLTAGKRVQGAEGEGR